MQQKQSPDRQSQWLVTWNTLFPKTFAFLVFGIAYFFVSHSVSVTGAQPFNVGGFLRQSVLFVSLENDRALLKAGCHLASAKIDIEKWHKVVLGCVCCAMLLTMHELKFCHDTVHKRWCKFSLDNDADIFQFMTVQWRNDMIVLGILLLSWTGYPKKLSNRLQYVVPFF